jgi:GDPmannose 4,6-dehydratase
LKKLGVYEQVSVLPVSLTNFASVLKTIEKTEPNEIYNFAGQSSVALSFEQPVETIESHAKGALNLLEAARVLGGDIRIFNAGSGECFGNIGSVAANEKTPFHPLSPYAVAKTSAFWETKNYREAYGIYACTGILFNHESPLRPSSFVTQKIVQSACRISHGSKETLKLGNLSIRRDWGWAEEYVDAMWRMLQQDKAGDFVIATGESHSLESFVAEVFKTLGLNWSEHVVLDDTLLRPLEILENKGEARKANKKLNWAPVFGMSDVAQKLVQAEMSN